LLAPFLVSAGLVEDPYLGVMSMSKDATVISRLDKTTNQPQIEYWNNTNSSYHYLITFVNTFETASTTNVMAINYTIYIPDDWELYQDDNNPNLVNFTSLKGNYLYREGIFRTLPAPFKNLTFMNYVNMMNTTTKSSNNRMNYKAGKFNIIMDQYNFTDTSSQAAAVLTFQLNQTYNGNLMNMPIMADQSLNLQFGGGYFAINNTATDGGDNTYSVSLAPAIKDFNFTNQTNGMEDYWVDNMQDAYIYFDAFPNGTITLDPEYGFGTGIETPGHVVIIVVVCVIGGVLLVSAVLAGIFIMRRRNQSKKNYQKF